jgi:hypothetical protein
MTKLSEIVRATQNAEETFEVDAAWALEQLIERPNPATDESDRNLLRLYANSVQSMGTITDELIRTWPETEAAQ